MQLGGTPPRAVLHSKAWTATLNPRVYPIILRGIRACGSPASRHGATALSLPADFLIEPDGRVRAARYGRHASDHCSVDELLQLARTPPARHPARATPEPRPGLAFERHAIETRTHGLRVMSPPL